MGREVSTNQAGGNRKKSNECLKTSWWAFIKGGLLVRPRDQAESDKRIPHSDRQQTATHLGLEEASQSLEWFITKSARSLLLCQNTRNRPKWYRCNSQLGWALEVFRKHRWSHRVLSEASLNFTKQPQGSFKSGLDIEACRRHRLSYSVLKTSN